MIALIAQLIERGHAYPALDGSSSVYFDTHSWPDYGELTRQQLTNLESDDDADAGDKNANTIENGSESETERPQAPSQPQAQVKSQAQPSAKRRRGPLLTRRKGARHGGTRAKSSAVVEPLKTGRYIPGRCNRKTLGNYVGFDSTFLLLCYRRALRLMLLP